MSTAMPTNDDLTWDLDDFGQAHRAMKSDLDDTCGS